ncbi:MAG: class I SAM-dependent methyltransferase [Candidatus Limnocylindrales bacterium]
MSARDVGSEAGFQYDDAANPHVLREIVGVSRVLDVGCGTGALGRQLKAATPSVVVHGVEANAGPARVAAGVIDRVVQGTFPEVTSQLDPPYDAVVFADVLEHMEDPWSALEATRSIVAPGGLVVASIPNIRYWPVTRALLLRGRFDYTETGVLDRTHLRFFTRISMLQMFEGAGLTVERHYPIPRLTSRVLTLAERLLSAEGELKSQQFVLRARFRALKGEG